MTDLDPNTFKSPTSSGAFRIVGVGASAGGLESLERFFGAMPPDTGMAFVVVQHLSPDFKTLMAELLARHSDMPIGLAVDGETVEPNRVYLLPPGKEIQVRGRTIELCNKEPRGVPQPINGFFRSLARDAGQNGVAVVLSGSGSDGAHGIVSVKESGGLVLAESPETALFDGMPSSAAATGLVDFIGAPHELAGYLCGSDVVRGREIKNDGTVDGPLQPDDPLSQVLGLLDEQFGIDFSLYKLTTVRRRLERRAGLRGYADMSAYLEELRADPVEQGSLYQDLLIGVTRFFRDLIEGDLRTVITGALARVTRERVPVNCPNVVVQEANGAREYQIRLEIIAQPRTDQSHVLVTLAESASVAQEASSNGAHAGGEVSLTQASREHMLSLEGELSYAREILQSTVEQLETSNEELQATNEELVASNEELQSTNEELHSVNEELYTVNAEYQAKIEELQQLNADIGHLLEGTEVGTVFLDRDLRIRRYTQRIGKVFRIQDRDIGREIRDFSHSLLRPTLIADIEAALRDGRVTEGEVRDEHGTPHFLRILPYRVGRSTSDGQPPDGRPISGVVLTITDISVLDKARERLAQLSAIVESSEDAILRKTLDGVIETWNRGAERLYGYTADEAIGKDVRFLCTPEGRADVDRFLGMIRRGERVDHVETMRVRKDGSPVDVSISISPVFDERGQVVAASAIARDITDLKVAQRELEERRQQIQQLLDSTAEAIYGVDPRGICTFCNPACVRLLGYREPADLIGRDMHEIVHRAAHTGITNHQECGLTNVYRNGEAAHSSDEVFWRADGTCFAAEYWSHPVEREGKLDGAVVTFLDITERRRAEEEVRAAARRRERFLAMLSHELRNPLAAVLNAVRVVSAGGSNEAQAKARLVIDRQGRHMARLLDDLLDVSRITSGKFELRKEQVRFGDSVMAAIEAVEPILRDHGITLSTSISGPPIVVDGDGARLQQVVANLLSNAARYSPHGSRVELSLRREGDVAVLSVRDWGTGIDAKLLPRIFDLFVQSEQASREARGGLGIGLALVRRIVELHDGTVEAKSAGRDLGSEFIVRIPCALTTSDRTTQPPVSNSEACRIVLVEDQEDAREMMRALLELRGHEVIEAVEGSEAITTIRRERPDVAVVDIGLPVVSGYEVARAVRESPEGHHVYLIALTGYGSQSDVRAAEDAGFDAHLTKPAEPDRLFRLLATRPLSESRRSAGAWSEVEPREN